MELVDLRMPLLALASKQGPPPSSDKHTMLTECKCIKKYKSFQGTIKSAQIVSTQAPAPQPAWYNAHKKQQLTANPGGLCVATCGLDRHMRVHHVETGVCVAKVYLKSRLNCLLFSKHEPVKPVVSRRREDDEELEEDQLSSVNSEDLGTDELWSDMETIVEDNPSVLLLKAKRKLNAKLEQVASDINEDENDQEDDKTFKKPK